MNYRLWDESCKMIELAILHSGAFRVGFESSRYLGWILWNRAVVPRSRIDLLVIYQRGIELGSKISQFPVPLVPGVEGPVFRDVFPRALLQLATFKLLSSQGSHLAKTVQNL